MQTYIALLRGINVGGKRKILMKDLTNLFVDLNFNNIKTYIQSGNVIFDSSKKSNNIIEEKISEAIFEKFKFEVPVIVRTKAELQKIISQNPFADKNKDNLHFTLLNEVPKKENIKLLTTQDFRPDIFHIKENNIFLFIEGKYHKSKLTNNFFESKLKVNTTTRNCKTIFKLLELANE